MVFSSSLDSVSAMQSMTTISAETKVSPLDGFLSLASTGCTAAVDLQSVIRSVPAFQIDLINSPTYNKWSISG